MNLVSKAKGSQKSLQSDRSKELVLLNGDDLTIDDVINVAKKNYRVDFPNEIKEKLSQQRILLEKQISQKPEVGIYGVNRLHGDLKDQVVSNDLLNLYQVKYLMTHNCGTGIALPIETVRAIMVIRLNSFARCQSGMKLDTCQLMIDMLNKGVTPWVLEEGSVGASGDLVPLAMIAATMIKELENDSKAYFQGKLYSAKEALEMSELEPITLGCKEAMGLTNGSNFIAGLAVLELDRAKKLLDSASITAALALEAIRGEKKAFSHLINEQSNRHDGQIYVAKTIRKLIEDSKRMTVEAQKSRFDPKSDKEYKERIQDRYSFRAIPQVHGTAIEAIAKLENTLQREINSTTDNPIFDFDDPNSQTNSIIYASGGNFHGQPLASVIDYVKATLTSVALITDKRTFTLLDTNLSYGLPSELAYNTENADGGLMITQYAGAARVAECRVLSTPASVMSVATAANQEDYVSMGSIGVLHLRKINDNLRIVIAIELLCAHRALQLTYDWLPKHLCKLGQGTQLVFDFLNQESVLPKGQENENLKDHYLRLDLEKCITLIKEQKLLHFNS